MATSLRAFDFLFLNEVCAASTYVNCRVRVFVAVGRESLQTGDQLSTQYTRSSQMSRTADRKTCAMVTCSFEGSSRSRALSSGRLPNRRCVNPSSNNRPVPLGSGHLRKQPVGAQTIECRCNRQVWAALTPPTRAQESVKHLAHRASQCWRSCMRAMMLVLVIAITSLVFVCFDHVDQLPQPFLLLKRTRTL